MLPRQRTFHWEPLTLKEKPLQVNDPVRGRYYVSPSGAEMESVTSFLGRIADKEHLDQWRERLLEKNIDPEEVMRAAGLRGSAMHGSMEAYLQAQEGWKAKTLTTPLFRQLKPVVDLCLGTIYAQEVALYSDLLNLAGTMDLFAQWKGIDSIIDWKSSTKSKKLEWIDGYFMQVCIYSLMLQERTGRIAKQLVVAIGTENDTQPTVFVQDRAIWVPRVMEAVRQNGLLSIPNNRNTNGRHPH